MSKQQVRYIVKRNYSTSRTGTDAFIKLIKNDKSRNKSPDISQNNNIRENNIEYTLTLTKIEFWFIIKYKFSIGIERGVLWHKY